MSKRDLTESKGGKISVWDIDGIYLPGFPFDMSKLFAGIKDIQAHPEDVLFCEYPKSGLHWVSEVVRILLSNGNLTPDSKYVQPIEFLSERRQKSLNRVPPPRVFASHLPCDSIPKSFFAQKSKIIFLVRDPRAVAVSFYHHLSKMKPEFSKFEGNWDQFFEFFLKGKLPANGWFDYIKKWEKSLDELKKSGHPVHIIQYEEFSKNTLEEIKCLSKFLGKEYSEEFYRNIAKVTDFQTMKKMKEADKKNPYRKSFENDFYPLYRKGKIDDWKNLFTVSQHEKFTEEFSLQMEKSVKLKSLL